MGEWCVEAPSSPHGEIVPAVGRELPGYPALRAGRGWSLRDRRTTRVDTAVACEIELSRGNGSFWE